MHWDQNIVTRIGMIFEFFSFWFAAPEILGQYRLRALEKRLIDGLQLLKRWFWQLGVLLLIIISVILVYKFWYYLVVNPIILVTGNVVAMVLAAIISRIPDQLADDILQPIFETLARDEGRRQRFLLFGAFLLTTGLGLQFIATFL